MTGGQSRIGRQPLRWTLMLCDTPPLPTMRTAASAATQGTTITCTPMPTLPTYRAEPMPSQPHSRAVDQQQAIDTFSLPFKMKLARSVRMVSSSGCGHRRDPQVSARSAGSAVTRHWTTANRRPTGSLTNRGSDHNAFQINDLRCRGLLKTSALPLHLPPSALSILELDGEQTPKRGVRWQ